MSRIDRYIRTHRRQISGCLMLGVAEMGRWQLKGTVSLQSDENVLKLWRGLYLYANILKKLFLK